MPVPSIRVIACGALAREILAVCEANGLSHVDLICLPAILHNHPEKIVPGLEKAIVKARSEGFDRIFLAYADCGTGGAIDRLCEKEGVARLAGPHCYSFFVGNEVFAKKWDDDLSAFFLTDFLARQFDAFVVEPLGLDRHPELRDAYFGHYTKLIYLSQVEDTALQDKARRAADFLGLTYEYRFTGYGDLATDILHVAEEARSD
jgi:hypothetical protein